MVHSGFAPAAAGIADPVHVPLIHQPCDDVIARLDFAATLLNLAARAYSCRLTARERWAVALPDPQAARQAPFLRARSIVA